MEGFPLQFHTKSSESGEMKTLVADIGHPHEVQEVFDFLKRYFLTSTPIRQVTPCSDDAGEHAPSKQLWLLELVKESLSLPYTILIRDPAFGHRLAAVLINTMQERNQSHNSDDESTDSDRTPGWLARSFLSSLSQGIDLFSLYNTDRVLGLFIVSVGDQYGRLGLATKMFEWSIEMAEAAGAGALESGAVSEFAAKALAKCGFKTIKTVPYESFEMKDGVRPMASMLEELGEHQVGRLMARRVRDL